MNQSEAYEILAPPISFAYAKDMLIYRVEYNTVKSRKFEIPWIRGYIRNYQ